MADDDNSTEDVDTGQDKDTNQADSQDSTTDDQSQGQQSDSTSGKDDEKDWKAEAEKWRSLARKHESRVKDLSPKAAKLQELEDKQKTELQKKEDQLATQAMELQRYKVAEIRRSAATAAGLDSEMAEFITAADEEEAIEQAKKLAERLKASGGGRSGAPDFKQGARQTPPPQRSRDELLRGLAGFGNH